MVAQGEENLVLLDQLAGHLHGLGRLVAVVVGDHVDLAAVDAAFGVDLVQIGHHDLGDDAVGGSRTGIGRGDADPDFVGARGRAGPARKPAPPSRQAPAPLQRCAEARRKVGAGRHGPRLGRLRRPTSINQSPHSACPLEQYTCDFRAARRIASQPYSLTLCLNRIDFVSRPVVSQRRLVDCVFCRDNAGH